MLPDALAELVLDLVATRRGRALLGDHGNSQWLFPGGRPGHPISPPALSKRLRQLGIHTRRARSSTLVALAAELPAAIIARILGIHISSAVRWQRASAGDWTTYAADISRRTERAHQEEQNTHAPG